MPGGLHFRARPRPEVRVRLRYRRLDELGARDTEAETRNIGVGGAFLIVPTPPPVGTPLELVIPSPATWEALRIRADVRWIEPSGMGVMFRDLEARHVVALHDFFVSLEFSET